MFDYQVVVFVHDLLGDGVTVEAGLGALVEELDLDEAELEGAVVVAVVAVAADVE